MADYTRLPLPEVAELDVFTYWLLLRDAVVYRYAGTEAGRRHLEDCWRYQQTRPDRASLRQRWSVKEEKDGAGNHS